MRLSTAVPLQNRASRTRGLHGHSKRAFQTQFRRWNFPPKNNPAHKNDRLVTRVRELWEKNLAQAEMLKVLNDEGFDIKARELMRVRTRKRWLLRMSNGDKMRASGLHEGSPKPGLSAEEDGSSPSKSTQGSPKTQERLVNSGRTLSKRQRRRAKHSAAPPGSIVRYPSEMTIDEARVFLGLDNDLYRDFRAEFQRICEDEGLIKKTIAGPERWEAAKARLVREMLPLQNVMWMAKDSPESKKQALDVICTDVTKRMRNMETRMTLTEAKNALGINPQESREMRTALLKILRDTSLSCKSAASPEEWEGLQKRWGAESERVRAVLTEEDGDSGVEEKTRALEVIAKDVMKRLRDDRVRKDPKRLRALQQSSTTPTRRSQGVRSVNQSQTQSSPSTDHMDMGEGMTGNFDAMSEVSRASQMPFGPSNGTMGSHLPISMQSQESSLSESPGGLSQQPRVLSSSMASGLPMDSQMGSSLLLAANAQTAFMDQPYVQQQFAPATPPAPVFHQVQPVPTVFAVYLRLHPSSNFVTHTNLWIATMTSQSLEELRQIAVDKFPGALCVRVQGILRDGKGGEIPLQIEQDQELGAYLAHMQGGSPTFNVQLVWKS